MTRYALGLGSNMGDRLTHLRSAVRELGPLGTIGSVAGLYETAPVGGPDQDPYLNTVVVIETELDPNELLAQLRLIEAAHDRKRTVKWGPRTLDIDIIASDGTDVTQDDLMIPHRSSAERRFVLEPLAEVWPEARVSGGQSASEALADVLDQHCDRLATRWAEEGAHGEGRWWVGGQMAWFLACALAMAYDGSLPSGEPEVSRLIGGLMVLFGAVLAYASLRRLGPGRTAMPEPIEGAFLVERGTYAMVRHPVYGGVTLLLVGVALVLDSVTGVIVSLGLFVFFYFKSRYEERQLRIAYPGYGAYRRRVTRRFVPFLF